MIIKTLKSSCLSEWELYTRHPFVQKISDGTLPRSSFQYYLQQDALFLLQFVRIFGLAIFKSTTLPDMRQAIAAITTILDTEIELHINFCKSWGISIEDLHNIKEEIATTAYIGHVLDTSMTHDLLALYTAVLPCYIGYAEIGKELQENPLIPVENNPYKQWIEMYSSDEVQESADAFIGYYSELAKGISESDKTLMETIFRKSVNMEIAFWNVALESASDVIK